LRLLFAVSLVACVVAACGSQQAPTREPLVAASETPVPSETAAPIASGTTAPVVTTPTTCKTNDDCGMSTSRSCCEPCGLPPFADLKSEVDSLRKKCSLVECSMRVPQECKPTESIDAYHAECHSAACVAVRNPPPRQAPIAPALLESEAACTTDADCLVTNTPSCCAGCQANAYATSQRETQNRRQRCAIVDCSMDRSTPCAEVVDAALYRATCRAHKCAGIKH
jgi:hypothetical protein